jgi:hypothetical protein
MEERRMAIEVWSWPTPNGRRVPVAPEALGLPCTAVPVDIGAGAQVPAERRRRGTITDAGRDILFGATQFQAR